MIVGGGALKEHLTKTTDAKAAIHSWVAQNSLETPSCQPAHELLDSMGFSRADQHKGVMNHLKDRLLARIDTMPQEMKLALLEKCFPYVTIPELRAVPVEILSKLPRVPVAYFAEIAKDAKLMSELPLAVRRQVWVQKVNPELFKSYILSLIRQYSLQPPLLGLVTGMKGASTKFKKARAANKALQDIVSACADVAPLYRETLDIIGQAYLDNPSDLALCSLRLQLPLAALEAGTKHVADTDASYKLAKCLCDAARDKDMKEAQVLKSLTDAQDMAKNLRPLQAAMLLRAPETTEFVTSALLAACRRVAENQSIPKQDATLKVGSKLLCWSAMEKLHLKLSFPREDPVGVLLEEFYPALLVCMVDDLLREGAGECEDLEPALHSVASSHSEARTLVLQYMHECISTDSIDAARFQKLIPLYKAAAVEAAAAAADLTPDTSDEVPVCVYLSEETRRLAAIARCLLDRHHKVGSGAGGGGAGGGAGAGAGAGGGGGGGGGAVEGVLECMGDLLPTVCLSLRDGCSVGATVAAFGLADVLCASPSPPRSVFCLYRRSLLLLY